MAGYTRQSSSSIADGEVITAAPLNSEFDALLAAFAFSGGHNHDGTSTEGAYVGILADVDALNKIVVDTANNRHGFFVEVSSSAVEQLRIQDGAIVPVTDSDIDLGTSSLEFKDLYIDGTAYIDTLEVHEGVTLSAGVVSLPDGSASAPVITNTGDTNQGLYFSGTDEMSFTAGGTGQVTFADGVIKPVTDNDIDLGTSSNQFKDLHINGTANIDALAGTTMSGNLAMGSNSITGLAAPSADGDAARKVYVDDSISAAEGLTQLAGNINVNGFFFFGSSGEDVKFKPQTGASVLSTQDTDGEFVALVLRNESDASDTTGIASLRFDLEDTGGNTVDAAKIAVKKEQTFTSTASSQDSKIVFSTSLNGTLTEYLELSSAGALVPVTNNTVDIGTSSKQIKDIYVDGTAYIDAIGFGTTSVTLPTSDGSANQILKTNGSGTISWANDTGTTINNATENELVTVSSTTTQLDGESNLTFDGTTLTLNGKLAMASNTAGKLLIADGTDFEPTAVGDLSEISTVASDDILMAVDVSGGGLKKITRSNLVSGLATSSAISNISEDSTPQLGGDLDAQGKDITDVGILSADASAGIYGPTGSPVVFTVTVASKTAAHPYYSDGSSSGYFLNGVESPAIKLHGVDSVTSSTEYFYKFDQADSSNSGHPLRFYLDAAKTIAYTTGVTTSGTPGTAGAHTTIAVTDQTPSTLYYQCSSHGYMGNYASVDSANITSSGAVTIDAVGDVTLDADGGDIVFKDASTTFGSATNTSGNLILKSGTTTALTFSGANTTAAGNIIVTGDLTVNGTTTTVNSTTVTIDDPIFTLGGDSAPGSDDNKDRGIEFRWHNGSDAKVGFFGYDDSASAFTFIPDATNSSEVFSGSAGNVVFGNITGTLQTAAQTNITSVGALDGGSITSGFGAIDNGTSGIRTNTFTAETSVVPDASGGADLGTSSLEWGDLYIADDKKIYLGSDQDVSIEYDEDGNDTTAIVAANGISFAPHGSSAGNGTELRFQELAANGANYVGFKAPDAISSNEVWVLPNTDGSADQVLKTDGSNNLSWVDQSGGGSAAFTASGSITAGKPLILNGSGQAEQVAISVAAVTESIGSQQDISGTGHTSVDAPVGCALTTDKILVAYVRSDNKKLVAKIGTVAADKTISYGSEVEVHDGGSGTIDDPSVAYDSNAGRIGIFFSENDGGTNPYKFYAATASFSGTTLTVNTPVDIGNIDADSRIVPIPVYDPDRNKVVVFVEGDTDYNTVTAMEMDLSGSSPSINHQTAVTGTHFSEGRSSRFSNVVYDTGSNRFLYMYGDDDDGSQIKVKVVQNTGSAFTWGSSIDVETEDNGSDSRAAIGYDPVNNKALVIFGSSAGGSSAKFYYSVGTITGGGTNSSSWTTPVEYPNFVPGDGTYDWRMVYHTTSGRFVFYMPNADGSSEGVVLRTGTLSGNTLTLSDTENVLKASSNSLGHGTMFGPLTGMDNSPVIATWGADHYAYLTIYHAPVDEVSNLTSVNFLGLAAASASNGQSVNVTIDSGVNENQSSLTAGTKYFSTNAGVVATSGTVFLGTALSSTSIQLEPASGTNANQLVRLDANSKLPAVDGSNVTSIPGLNSIDMTIASDSDAISVGDLITKESNGETKKIKKTTTTTDYTFSAVSGISTPGSGLHSGTTYEPDQGGRNMMIGGSTDGRFLCIYNSYWQISYAYQYCSFIHSGSGTWTTGSRASIGTGANTRMHPRVRWISNLNSAAGGTFVAAFLTANGWKHTAFTITSSGAVTKYLLDGQHYWVAPNDSTSNSSTNYGGDTTIVDTSTDDTTVFVTANRVSSVCYINKWTISWNGSSYAKASSYRTSFSNYTSTQSYGARFVRIAWDHDNDVGIVFCLDSNGRLTATKFTLGSSAASRTYGPTVIRTWGNSINDDPRSTMSVDGHGQVFFSMATQHFQNNYPKMVGVYNTTGNSADSSYWVSIMSRNEGGGVPHMSYDFLNKKLFIVADSGCNNFGANNIIRQYTFTGTTQDSVTEVSNYSSSFDASSDSVYCHVGQWAIPDTQSVSAVTDPKGGYWMGIYMNQEHVTSWDNTAELKTGVLPHSLTTSTTNKSDFYGVAETGGSAGSSIKVIGKDSEGIIHNRSGLTSGTNYFASDTGTLVTTTTGGTDISNNVDNPLVGQAITATDIRFPSINIAGDPKVFCGAVDFRRDSGVGSSVIISKPSDLDASQIRAYEIHFYGVGVSNDTSYNIRFKPYKNGSSVMSGNFKGVATGNYNGSSYQSANHSWSSYLSFRMYSANYPYRANSASIQNYSAGGSHSGKLTGKVVYENNIKNAAFSYVANVRTGASDYYMNNEMGSFGSTDNANTTDYAEQFYFYPGTGSFEEGIIAVYAIKK